MELFKEEWEQFKAQRWAQAKKWLRRLPSRSCLRKNIFARKLGLSYLFNKMPQVWSFAYRPMRNAYYVGWVLTCLPVMGIQCPLGILLSILFRANIMVVTALQFISNPLTVGFLWTFEYYIAKQILSWIPFTQTLVSDDILQTLIQQPSFIEALRYLVTSGVGLQIFLLICFGGVIIGLLFGYVSCCLHKYFFLRVQLMNYEKFVAMKQKELERVQRHLK